MSNNTTQIDFVTERMQASKQFPELTWCEFCVAFQKAWEYSENSGFDNLKMYVHDFAQVAVDVKKCQN
jgi:hypothetical protein